MAKFMLNFYDSPSINKTKDLSRLLKTMDLNFYFGKVYHCKRMLKHMVGCLGIIKSLRYILICVIFTPSNVQKYAVKSTLESNVKYS